MTCIVGIQTKDGVVLAADSLGSNGHTAVVRSDTKLFVLRWQGGSVGIGITGSYRMGQVVAAHLQLPTPTSDTWKWLVKDFIPALRAVLSEHGVARKEHEVQTMDDGAFLLATNSRLFLIGSDYQVGESACGYDAVGSGTQCALGALSALTGGYHPSVTLASDEARGFARLAIEAAEEHTPHVRGPVNFLEIP